MVLPTTLSKELLKPFLPQNPLIIEAGVHKAGDTLDFIKRWPMAKVYGFEPVPELFEKARNKTAAFSQIMLFQQALGEIVGTQKLYVSHGIDTLSSLLEPGNDLKMRPRVSFSEHVVSVTTLDVWAQKHGVSSADLLWLDLQGYELPAVRGASQFLKHVTVIVTEVNKVERYTGGTLYQDLTKFLNEYGFVEKHSVFGTFGWGTALFVKMQY